ncbi:SRPBCC family protein [Nocardioides sp.]|uniref:SRPBCC family protein n=1 Tax=Nocardioides sp. TaxID=35761 RepID=UPI003784F17D
MELTHSFTVPTGVEETWAHFQDIAQVAECFPGATVTSVGDDSFSGSVKVKLGPIALVYNGSGTFVEKDDAAHRFVVDAKGKDKRGNGTAGALVTLTMAETDGATSVEVVTDLAITGKPAQFGRGVMQDVSDKLLGQFVDCLHHRLAEGQEAPAAAEPASSEPSAESAAGIPTDEVQASGPEKPAERPWVSPTPAPAAPGQDDALDLGAAVLPVLARSYWKQGVGVVAVLALLWWLVRRRRD